MATTTRHWVLGTDDGEDGAYLNAYLFTSDLEGGRRDDDFEHRYKLARLLTNYDDTVYTGSLGWWDRFALRLAERGIVSDDTPIEASIHQWNDSFGCWNAEKWHEDDEELDRALAEDMAADPAFISQAEAWLSYEPGMSQERMEGDFIYAVGMSRSVANLLVTYMIENNHLALDDDGHLFVPENKDG